MLRLSLTHVIHHDHRIPGLCIVGDTYQDAIVVADMARSYYETPGLKDPIVVSFSHGDEETVEFVLDFGPAIGAVNITDVDGDFPPQIHSAIREFGAFFILLGFGEHDITVIDPKTFHMVKRDLVYNGRHMLGAKRSCIDWVDVFRT
jgi:hypothetical protein